MIITLLERLFSSEAKKNNIEERQLKELAATVENGNAANETTVSATSSYETDIAGLEGVYGKLYDGMVIETDLHTMLSICPRNRKRSDAYKGLMSQLRRSGVTLSIVNSPKSK